MDPNIGISVKAKLLNLTFRFDRADHTWQISPGTHYTYLAFQMLSRIEKGSWWVIQDDESRWWFSGLVSDIWLTEFFPACWLDMQPAKWKWISHEAFGTSAWAPYPRMSDLLLRLFSATFLNCVTKREKITFSFLIKDSTANLVLIFCQVEQRAATSWQSKWKMEG